MVPIARILLTAALLTPASAGAQPVRDEASGLAVAPPTGYAVRPIAPSRGQAARFEVKTPADADTGCQVSFTPAPQNNRFSQAELDTILRGRAWQDAARTAFAGLYEIGEAAVLEGGTPPAFAMVGDFQDRPGLPPRAAALRSLIVVRETPRGRTATICVGERAGFEARRAEFTAIATGATAP